MAPALREVLADLPPAPDPATQALVDQLRDGQPGAGSRPLLGRWRRSYDARANDLTAPALAAAALGALILTLGLGGLLLGLPGGGRGPPQELAVLAAVTVGPLAPGVTETPHPPTPLPTATPVPPSATPPPTATPLPPTGVPSATPVCADGWEPNDTPVQARSLPAEGVVRDLTLCPSGDVDYFLWAAAGGIHYSAQTFADAGLARG